MLKILALFESVPALSALLFSPLPDEELLYPFIERFSFFLMLLFSWKILRTLVVMYGHRKPDSSRISTGAGILTLFVFGLVVLACLTSLRSRTTPSIFWFVILTLAVTGLNERFRHFKKPFPHLLTQFSSYAAASYLSFLLLLTQWQWQVILVAGGIASISLFRYLAPVMSDHFESRPSKGKGRKRWAQDGKKLVRLYILLLLAAPVFIVTLVYLRQLPAGYLLTLLLIPLSQSHVRAVHATQESHVLPDDFQRETTGIYCLFIVILALIGAIS